MLLSSLKRISLHSIIYGTGRFVPKLIGFFLIPIYTRFLTPADYGILGIAAVVSAILGPVLQFGFSGTILHFYYQLKGVQRKIFLGNLWLFKLVASLVLVVVLVALGPYLTSLVFKEYEFFPYLFLVIVATFFGSFNIFPNTLFRVENKPISFSLLSLSQFLVGVSLVIYFVVFLRRGAQGALEAGLITSFIFFFIYFFTVKKNLLFKFDFSKLSQGLRYGFPLIPHGLSGWSMTFIDRILLERMTSLASVGIYSLGYNFGQIMALVNHSINLAWLPFFYETAKKKGEAAKPLFSRILTYYFLVIISVAFLIAFASHEVVTIMAHKRFVEAQNIVPIVALGYLFHGFYIGSVNPLFLKKKTVIIAFSSISSAVLNIILNIIFIPMYGIYGAAWSTVVAFFVLFVMIYYFSQKYYPLKYEWLRIFKVLFIAGLVFYVGVQFNNQTLIVSILIKIALLFTYLVLIYVSGFFGKEDIAKIKKVVSFRKISEE